ATASRTRVFMYAGLTERAFAQSRLGNHAAARADLLAFKAMSHEFSQQISYGDWYVAAEAQILLHAGDVPQALIVAERGVELSRSMQALFGWGLTHRVWGQALAKLNPHNDAQAEMHFAES